MELCTVPSALDSEALDDIMGLRLFFLVSGVFKDLFAPCSA